MKVIKPPSIISQHPSRYSIFLAGSIEMGAAEKWQDKVISALSNEDIHIFNPRRDDWDSSWIQDISNPQFREQVEWELNAINYCSQVLMYFDKNTKSPITLLELGILTAKPNKITVCCPEGFYRKGNVDIVCKHYGIETVNTLEELIEKGRR